MLKGKVVKITSHLGEYELTVVVDKPTPELPDEFCAIWENPKGYTQKLKDYKESEGYKAQICAVREFEQSIVLGDVEITYAKHI